MDKTVNKVMPMRYELGGRLLSTRQISVFLDIWLPKNGIEAKQLLYIEQ